MRVELYLKPSCTTCRDAVAFLKGRGHELVLHDLAKDPPSRALLERIVDPEHLERFINPRSRSFKAMGVVLDGMTRDRAIDLVLQDTNLMKRPLMMTESVARFGFTPENVEALGA